MRRSQGKAVITPAAAERLSGAGERTQQLARLREKTEVATHVKSRIGTPRGPGPAGAQHRAIIPAERTVEIWQPRSVPAGRERWRPRPLVANRDLNAGRLEIGRTGVALSLGLLTIAYRRISQTSQLHKRLKITAQQVLKRSISTFRRFPDRERSRIASQQAAFSAATVINKDGNT